jgi:siroheme synthase
MKMHAEKREAEVLAQAGIPFEAVPGVSSFHAVPCYAGVPLTHHEHNSIVTGLDDPLSPANKLDWAQLAATPDTLVVLMDCKRYRKTSTRTRPETIPCRKSIVAVTVPAESPAVMTCCSAGPLAFGMQTERRPGVHRRPFVGRELLVSWRL